MREEESHTSKEDGGGVTPAEQHATASSDREEEPVVGSGTTIKPKPTSAVSAPYHTPPSDSTSEEEEEENGDGGSKQPVATAAPFIMRRHRSQDSYADDDSGTSTPEIYSAEAVLPDAAADRRTYIIAADDKELRRLLKRGLERGSNSEQEQQEADNYDNKGLTSSRDSKRAKATIAQAHDMKVITRQFSAFDRQNELSAASTFHGFYVLFWIAVAVLIVKVSADNWRQTGNPFGHNELLKYMFARDVLVLLISDGLMCGVTGVSWVLQRLVLRGYIDWNRSGWILQNVWQTLFIAGVVGLTLVRDWPWTHTVYFVLHGLVMLMKQHSYAFTNGHLSTVYRERQRLLALLKQLEDIEPCSSEAAPSNTGANSDSSSSSFAPSSLSTAHLKRRPSASEYYKRQRRLSTSHQQQQQQPSHDDSGAGASSSASDDIRRIDEAVASGRPLTADQLTLFARLVQWEADALGDELRGGSSGLPSERWYPHNTTLANFYEYIVLPTLVYELQYARLPAGRGVDWWYVAEKAAAMVGVIFVMTMVSQTFIYPVVVRTLSWKAELGWDTARRFQEFPWLLSDLLFPFMIEYLLAWYLIWETILNILAELTCFADRSFYDAWWNSVSWDQFARDWNRPVHNFLLRHVYHSSISAMRVRRETATLITFFLSACVHELVMWCIFKKLRGYLLALQMCQLPLVRLSRTRWLRHRKTLGNMIFWVGIFTGPSLLCSLYLVL